MGFDVRHSPSAASLGAVSRQAGLGNYSRFMQQMIEQQNARKQQERMQKRSLSQQQSQFESSQQFQKTRDKDYQQFQQDMKLLGLGMQRQGKLDDLAIRTKLGELSGQIKEKEKQHEFLRFGWNNFVGKIKNFDDWNPTQKQKFEGFQKEIQEVMSSPARTDDEKEDILQKAIRGVQLIQATVVPRKKTQQDAIIERLKADGISPGVPFYRNGGVYNINPETLEMRAVVQPPKGDERAKTYNQIRESLAVEKPLKDLSENKATGGTSMVYPTHKEIVEAARSMGIDWIEDYDVGTPGGGTGGDVQRSPLEEMVASPEGRREVYYQLENVVSETGLTQEQIDAMSDKQVINLIRIEEKMKNDKGMSNVQRRF